MNEYKIIFENGDYLYTRMNAGQGRKSCVKEEIKQTRKEE